MSDRYNFEFLQESYDEQQKAIVTITNSLEFLTQIRANQRRQLLAVRDELCQTQRELELAKVEIERLTIENTELKPKSALPTHCSLSISGQVKHWVGKLKRSNSY